MNKKRPTEITDSRVKKRNVVGRDQVEMLIVYMEEHILFARGQIPLLGPQGHVKYKNMWTELTEKLNNLGPCVQTSDKWQEKWKNLRISCKQRMAAYMHQYRKTGGTCPDVHLKEEDERVCNIFGKYGVGLNVRPESGFKHTGCSLNLEESTNSSIFTACVIEKVESEFQRNMTNLASQFHSQFVNMYEIDDWTAKKVSEEQKDILIKFMTIHSSFAKNPADKELWEELVQLLNSFEPKKSLKSWQKTWADSVKAAQQAVAMFNTNLRSEPVTNYHLEIVKLLNAEINQTENTFKNKSSFNNVQSSKTENSENVYLNLSIQSTSQTPTIQRSRPSESMLQSRHVKQSTIPGINQRSPLVQSQLQNRMPIGRIFSAASTSAVAEAAKVKADNFMNTLKMSQQETTNQIVSCFEKQNNVIRDSFKMQNDTLSILPIVIAAEVEKAMNKTLKEFFTTTSYMQNAGVNLEETTNSSEIVYTAALDNDMATFETSNTYAIKHDEVASDNISREASTVAENDSDAGEHWYITQEDLEEMQ